MFEIAIAGAGFAACTAVKTLRKRGFKGKISVIAPRPELFYYPSLIWVPAGRRDLQDLTIPLHDFFARHDVNYVQSTVSGIDTEQRQFLLETGSIPFDAAIIASGGRYLQKLPGIELAHIACSGWQQTKAFSDRLAELDRGTIAFGFAGNPKEPSAMRGGPVFEFMFGVDTLLRKQKRRQHFELVFFSPAPRPGQRMGDKAVDRVLGEMEKRDIKTYLGNKLKGFSERGVETEATRFDTDLILFIPGMTGPQWAADSGLSLSEGGFFKANEFCQVDGQQAIFVAGDAGSFPGPDWKPKQAHMADLQAEAAARNAIDVLHHKPASHTFKTELICIVDTLNNGSLVYRAGKRNWMLKMPPLHWLKLVFERLYLRAYS